MPKKQTEYPHAIVIPPPPVIPAGSHVFKEGELIAIPDMKSVSISGKNPPYLLGRRTGGCFAEKAFFLSEDYDWTIAHDGAGHIVLIPTKK